MIKIKLPKLPKIFIAKNIQNIIDTEVKKAVLKNENFNSEKIKNITDHYESVIKQKDKNYIDQIKILQKSNNVIKKNVAMIQDERNEMEDFAFNIQTEMSNLVDFVVPKIQRMIGQCMNHTRIADKNKKKHDTKFFINRSKSEKYERKIKEIQENQLALPMLEDDYDCIEKG